MSVLQVSVPRLPFGSPQKALGRPDAKRGKRAVQSEEGGGGGDVKSKCKWSNEELYARSLGLHVSLHEHWSTLSDLAASPIDRLANSETKEEPLGSIASK